ncbi:MAG: hypothetical protein IIA83_09590 [Thaumarchaeota archaeon]|nr:hypothetical protein [Nitrososphaerota archaeon]
MSEDLPTTISLRIPGSIVIHMKRQAGILHDENTPVIYNSVTDAIIQKIKLADLVESFKSEVNKPDFLDKIRKMQEHKSIDQWLETLSDDEKRAIRFLIDNHFARQEKVSDFVRT